MSKTVNDFLIQSQFLYFLSALEEEKVNKPFKEIYNRYIHAYIHKIQKLSKHKNSSNEHSHFVIIKFHLWIYKYLEFAKRNKNVKKVMYILNRYITHNIVHTIFFTFHLNIIFKHWKKTANYNWLNNTSKKNVVRVNKLDYVKNEPHKYVLLKM